MNQQKPESWACLVITKEIDPWFQLTYKEYCCYLTGAATDERWANMLTQLHERDDGLLSRILACIQRPLLSTAAQRKAGAKKLNVSNMDAF